MSIFTDNECLLFELVLRANIVSSLVEGTSNSVRILLNKINSPTTSIISMHYDLAKERDIVACFFDFQLIGLFLFFTIYPVTYSMESGQEEQYELQYALRLNV